MKLQSLRFPGLQLVDPNTEYSGEQVIYLDFDGEENVSYDNKTLGLTVGGITVSNSGLSEDEIAEIVQTLNRTFADTEVTFTIDLPPEAKEHSTIYIGGTGNAFSEYGSFLGLSETIDAGNQIKTDEAFVFSDKLDSPAALTETITHEAAHLLGYEHENDTTIDFLENFAATYSQTYNNGSNGSVPITIEKGEKPTFKITGLPADPPLGGKNWIEWNVGNTFLERDDWTLAGSEDFSQYTFSSVGTYEVRGIVYIGTYKETHLWTVTVAYDDKAPNSVTNLDLLSSYDSGTSSSDNITKNTSLKFTWSASSDNGVSGLSSGLKGYYWSLTDSSPDSNDNFTTSRECTFSKSDGNYTLYVSAVDNNGNVSSASSISFTVDTAKPTVTLSSPGSSTSDTTPTFSWRASDLGGIDYYVLYLDGPSGFDDGVYYSGSSTSWTPSSSLSYGNYTWKVKAVDKAGNVGDYCDAWALTVTSTPDLNVVNFDCKDEPWEWGTTVPIDADIENKGTGDATNLTITLIASNDATLGDGDDYLIKSWTGVTIKTGSHWTISDYMLSLPSFPYSNMQTTGSTYYFIKVSDASGETNLGNNYASDVVTMKSDYLIDFHTWDQSGAIYLSSGTSDIAYNQYTPTLNGTHTQVGCTAIAMSQLIYFWGEWENENDYNLTINSISFDESDSYTTSEGIQIDDDASYRDFLNFTKLDNKLSNIEYDFDPDEIAALCFGIGVKLHADYGEDDTGAAYSLSFLQELGFSSAKTVYESDDDGLLTSTRIDLEDTLINNIESGCPVLVSMLNVDDNKAHAIIIDGYDATKDQFHFNMGWGGARDDWYSLDNLPNNYDIIHQIFYNLTLINPDLEVSANSHDFGSSENGWSFKVGNNTISTTLSYSISCSASWLIIGTYDGKATSANEDTVTLTIDRSKLSTGTNETTITVINANDSNDKETITISAIGVAAKPSVTVKLQVSNAGEASNDGVYRISRTGSTDSALTVYFSMSGTATPNSDYNIGNSVTIAAGASYADVTLDVIDDSEVEATESAILTLTGNNNYIISSPSGQTINILDNDIAADQYEADNTANQAKEIAANGIAQNHTIHVKGDEDWLKFYVESPSKVEIKVSRGDSKAHEYTVYGPGSSTAEIYHTASSGIFSRQLSSGWYYIKSWDPYNDDTAAYSISVTAAIIPLPDISVLGGGSSNDAYKIASGDTTPGSGDDTDFGMASVSGESVLKTFTVRNTGEASLNISGFSLSDTDHFSFAGGNTARSLGIGESTTFTIRFDPAGTGTKSCTVTINSDDPDEGTYAFTILGTGTESVLAVSTTTLDFGSSLNTLNFTIRNSGTGTLDYSLSESLDWLSLSVLSGTSTGEADSVSAAIDRSKLGYGVKTGTITITGNGGTQTITVSADGGSTPERIYNSRNNHYYQIVYIASGINWDNAKIAAQNVGGYLATITSASENQFITDLYTQNANIKNVWIGGYQAEGASEPQGGWQWVTGEAWDYTNWNEGEPNNSGNEQYLQCNNDRGQWNDANYQYLRDANAYIIEWGEINPPETINDISVLGGGSNNDAYEIVSGDTTPGSEDDTDFGTASVSGGSVLKTFTVRNIGEASLNISGFSLSDTDHFSFAGGNTARSLGVGESTTFSVRFDPAGTGTKSCTVTINSDDPDEGIYVFTIQGTGTESVLAVSTTTLDFGNALNTLNFTIRNSGTGTLDYSLSESLDWLSLSILSGTSTGEADSVTAAIDRSKLGYGVQTETITITGNGGTQTITVSADGGVEPLPILAVSTPTLDFGNALNTLNFTIRNSGTGTLDYSLSESLDWLSLSILSGTSTGEADSVTAAIDRSKLGYGVQTGTITITGNGGTQTITVSAERVEDDNWWDAPVLEAVPGEGITDGWVGFGDRFDYRKLQVDVSGMYTMTISGLENPAKLTLYTVNSKGALKALKKISVTPKFDKAGNVVKNDSGTLSGLLLTAGNEYYISVEAAKAATSKNTGYDLSIDGIQFLQANQAADDDWRAAPVLEAIPGEGIPDEWVGFGDGIDYRKLQVDEIGSYTLTLSGLGNAARLTLYTVDSKGALKALKRISVTPKFDKAGNVVKNDSGTLSGLLLSPESEYYISVEATKAKTAKNTGYELLVEGTRFDNPYNGIANDNWGDAEVAELDLAGGLSGEWVGFGDATDYFRFELSGEQAGAYGLNLNLENEKSAQMTVYKISRNKNGKTVMSKVNAKQGVFQLVEGEYAVKVASADNGKGKRNTGYGISIDLPDLEYWRLDAGATQMSSPGSEFKLPEENKNTGLLA